jgi:uncharacterized protein with beta-barrel porin domain
VGAFHSQTADVARNGALLGLGETAGWKNGVSASFSYNGEFRSGFTNHAVNGGARIAF